MNKTYKIQAVILLSIGLLLSPAIGILLSAYLGHVDDVSGIASFVIYVIYPLPAFISVMCLAFGVGRLIATHKDQAIILAQVAPADRQKDYQQKKSNLTALIVGTALLATVAVGMLLFVVYLWQQENGLFLLIFPGAVPISIVIFAVVMLPINIKNISKQKKALIR